MKMIKVQWSGKNKARQMARVGKIFSKAQFWVQEGEYIWRYRVCWKILLEEALCLRINLTGYA